MKKLYLTLCAMLISVVAHNAWAQYSGPGYYRLQNAQTGRYVNAVDNKGVETRDVGGNMVTSPSFNSIDLVSGDPTLLPGSIIYIDGTDDVPMFGQGLDLQTQGIGTMKLTKDLLDNFESLLIGLLGGAGNVEIDADQLAAMKEALKQLPGIPVHIDAQADGTYIAYIQATMGVGDESSTLKANFVDVEGNRAHFGDNFDILTYGNGKRFWKILPVNETDNYFAVVPNATAVDGKYYTTLSVDFGYKILSEGVTAYIATDVDNNGVPQLRDIATTGGLVPRGASVVIESASAEPVKLLPMDGADASVLEDNQLTIGIDEEGLPSYYAEVRNADTEDFVTLADASKLFTKTFSEGEMLPGNKAFFNNGNRTLQWIVNHGRVGMKYKIKDALQVVHALPIYDNKGINIIKYIVFVKDDNNFLDKSVLPSEEGIIDYMGTRYEHPLSVDKTDQSNWLQIDVNADIASYLGNDIKIPAQNMEDTPTFLGLKLVMNDVYGELTDKDNPTLTLLSAPTFSTQESPASVNAFIPASFYESPLQQSTVNDRYYFFVQPKPQEVAFLAWGVYNGNGAFVMPKQDIEGGVNGLGLQGGYSIDLTYALDEAKNMTPRYSYEFYGVIKKKVSSATAGNRVRDFDFNADEPISEEYEVWPFYIEDWSGVVTSVATVSAAKQVVGVEYVNLAGQRSARPWGGVNIVVTRYSDGTTASTKALF